MRSIDHKWNLGLVGMAVIWLATTAQAQLYIDVYPSQDNPDSQTIWIFRSDSYDDGPGSPPFYGGTIRGVGGTDFHRRDSWKAWVFDIYLNYKPTNVVFALSPLLSSANTKDIASVTTRLAGSSRVTSPFYSGVTFPTNSTNSATMTFGSASKTIGGIFMNVGPNLLASHRSDEIGIRGTSGANLAYNTNGATFAWFGAGLMNKPIDDFHASARGSFGSEITSLGGNANRPHFMSLNRDRIELGINSQSSPNLRSMLWCLACLRWPL